MRWCAESGQIPINFVRKGRCTKQIGRLGMERIAHNRLEGMATFAQIEFQTRTRDRGETLVVWLVGNASWGRIVRQQAPANQLGRSDAFR